MNEPPGARLRVGLTALTVAEYFRDEENQDVLLFIDNIFRFTQAGSEVSALLGRMPQRRRLSAEPRHRNGRVAGAHHFHEVGFDHFGSGDLRACRRLHRSRSSRRRLRTWTQRRTSSRQIAELGIYPAVDPLAIYSRILDPRIVGDEHYTVARSVKSILQRYKDLQDIIAILGIEELSEEDKLHRRSRA